MVKSYNVLFVCTGNSARSILAEAIMNHASDGRFRAFSAGSFPKGAVHPYTLDLLRTCGIPVDGLRSKSWKEFAAPDASAMDFVFTVCDQAAAEPCPAWVQTPIRAHWGTPDPAAVAGSELERRAAFRDAFAVIERRIKIFMSLPVEALDRIALQGQVVRIGRDQAA